MGKYASRGERAVVTTRIIERWDIVRVPVPTLANEDGKELGCMLVLSPGPFNELGVAIVAPIVDVNRSARYAGFAVHLTGSGTKTEGAAMVNMLRPLDLKARKAERIEAAPEAIVDDALARIRTFLG